MDCDTISKEPKAIKLLHINSYYIAGKFYRNLFDEQKKKNIYSRIFLPIPKSTHFVKEYFDSNTDISANHHKFDRYFFHIKNAKITKDAVRKYSKDAFNLIHAHSLFSNGFVAYKLAKKWKIPYIVAVRNTDVNVFFKYMVHLRPIGKKILEHAGAVIFLSPSYRDFVLGKFIKNESKRNFIREKSYVVPNGIDTYWFDNIGISKKSNNMKEINLLTVGDISKNKNQLTVCKACKLLQESGYTVNYTIIGPTKNVRYLEKIKSFNFVKHIDKIGKEELLKHYRASDIFVMPSFKETFGLVYAEAMSQGVPVIYSQGQGFDQQFEEGCVGFHVGSNDVQDIINKIMSILNNYESISKNCLKLVKKFEWSGIQIKYDEIYNFGSNI